MLYVCLYAARLREKVEELLQWLLEQRDCGFPISTNAPKKALSIIRPYNPAFTTSEGWVSKFIRSTPNLVLWAGINFTQRLPKDLENRISAFRSELKEIWQQRNYFLMLFAIWMRLQTILTWFRVELWTRMERRQLIFGPQEQRRGI